MGSSPIGAIMLDTLVKVIPAIVAVLYGITALGYALKKDWPWALVWGCYSLSNIGLILAAAKE
jgi:hypothetical protein